MHVLSLAITKPEELTNILRIVKQLSELKSKVPRRANDADGLCG
jgi:hypothetical protein